jgi:hypothetical protein
MHGPEHVSEEVQWWQEGDAWLGTLGGRDYPSWDEGGIGRGGFEVEVLLRATDWHIEMSHPAWGAFEREHIQAADAEEAKSRAADLLRAFRAKREAHFDGDREVHPSI